MTERRLRIGRLAVYIEPRDIWIGVFIAPAAIYVCPLPLVVLKWERGQIEWWEWRVAQWWWWKQYRRRDRRAFRRECDEIRAQVGDTTIGTLSKQPPPPMRIDPDIIGNHEDPRAAAKDRAAAEEILRKQQEHP